MRRIGIDCRFAGSHSGLGRYTRELVTELVKRETDATYILFVQDTEEDWLATLPDSTEVVHAPYPHYSFVEQFVFPFTIKRAKPDVYFATHFNVPIFCSKPFVLTVHDLILHRFPNQASVLKRAAYKFLMKRNVRRAARIIAVSEFTRKELSGEYGHTVEQKTTVIYEGVHPRFAPASDAEIENSKKRYSIDSPFFLYVGNAKQHKNVQLLLDAFAAFENPDFELLLITSGKEAVPLTLPKGARCVADVPDSDLPAFYSAATAFVSASAYEGFGLPIAEALCCGCPVIVTRQSAIPEVAGENALYADLSVESFSRMMSLAASKQHAVVQQEFLWSKAAKETAELFRTVE